MLNSKISRAQQCQQLAVSCRLVLAHLGNCRWTAVPEVSQQRRDELAIQLLAMTRADRTASDFPCRIISAATLSMIEPADRRAMLVLPLFNCWR
jgi:hypothetical protein